MGIWLGPEGSGLFCFWGYPRPHPVLFSGAEKRTKRDIHLTPSLPYREGINLLRAETALRKGFSKVHKAFALKGELWVVYRLAWGKIRKPGGCIPARHRLRPSACVWKTHDDGGEGNEERAGDEIPSLFCVRMRNGFTFWHIVSM